MSDVPDGETTSVPQRQNLESNLSFRRAIAQSYYLAKANLAGQLILTVLIPTSVALLSIVLPELRPFMVVLSVMAMGVDLFYLDRRQKKLLRTAALSAERFDCDVLDLPSNKTATGALVKDAIVQEYSSNYKRRIGNDDRLIDWYPTTAALAPAHQARLICQLTNAQYDGRLRAVYRTVVGLVALLCIAALLIAAIAARLPADQLAIVVIIPSLPMLLWTGREFLRQWETDGPLRDIQDRAFELWSEALQGEADPVYFRTESRNLQDAIFGYRLRSPLPVPFIYSALRKGLEDKMYVSAADRLREAGFEPEKTR